MLNKVVIFFERPFNISFVASPKVHQEWMNTNWPNLIRLKNIGLVCVFASFAILVLIPVLTFCLLSLPYGWPEISFFIAVPKSKQILVYAALITSLLLPVVVSCVLYFLIYFAVISKDLNRVGTAADKAAKSCDDVSVGHSQFCENVVEDNFLTNEKKEIKTNAERLAALRSLKTNLYFF